MASDDSYSQIRSADHQIQGGAIPDDVDRRLRKRLFAGPATAPSRAPWRLPLVLAATASVAGLVFVLRPTVPSETIEGFAVAANCVETASSADGIFLIEDCSLRLETAAVTIHARRGARLERKRGRVKVTSGKARFQVAKRRAGETFRVEVSHAVIEVIGTQFLVEQGDYGGRVTVSEGTVRLVERSGQSTLVRAGEAAGWGDESASIKDNEDLPKQAEPERRPSGSRKAKETLRRTSKPHRAHEQHSPLSRHPSPREVASLLQAVERLRLQQGYEEAIALIITLGRNVRSRRVASRLSFEVGSMLTYRVDDQERGCAHWQHHRRQFDTGRYAEAIEQAEQALGCQR